MNFLAVGFLLCNLQLGLGQGWAYAVRLVGALFMLMGIAELKPFEERAETLRPQALCLTALCAAATAAVFAANAANASDKAVNICAALSGALTTACVILLSRKLIALLLSCLQLFRRGGLIELASKHYRIMIVLAAVFIPADIINRFAGGTKIADVAGLIMFLTKLVYCIYFIVTCVCWGRIRADFNSTHSDPESDK
ncbi:MAG: hypothetical protein IKO44_00265 [Ruminococcus sp.]|nr:hypothetical protein [Ruminococcus sp.]